MVFNFIQLIMFFSLLLIWSMQSTISATTCYALFVCRTLRKLILYCLTWIIFSITNFKAVSQITSLFFSIGRLTLFASTFFGKLRVNTLLDLSLIHIQMCIRDSLKAMPRRVSHVTFSIIVFFKSQYDWKFISFPMPLKNAVLGRSLGFFPTPFLQKCNLRIDCVVTRGR